MTYTKAHQAILGILPAAKDLAWSEVNWAFLTDI
jgi:hypothetical protein